MSKDEKYNTRGPFRKQPLATNSMDERPNLRFPILWNEHEIWPEKQWQWSKERVELALKNNELVFTQKKNGWTIDYKQYLKDENGEIRKAKLYSVHEGPYTQIGTGEIKNIFGDGKIFSFPKPSGLIRHFAGLIEKNALVLDFFSGACTTAHAIMKLNAEDGGKRKFIMVQLPEPCDEKSEAFKAGYKTIAEIGKERIRRAGAKIKTGLVQAQHDETRQLNIFGKNYSASPVAKNLDIGFRVFKLDSSNMRDVYYTPDEIKQGQLELYANNIKGDRRPEDLLFQVFLDWGLELTLPVLKETIEAKTVFFVDDNVLAACFDPEITEELVKILAKRKPLRAVFRDDAYGSDSVKINVEQIFKLISPTTEVKSL